MTGGKENSRAILVTVLGGFTIMLNGQCISQPISHSKKLKSVAAYLIMNQDHAVSYDELFTVLWPDERGSSNPYNALKALMHRLRGALVDGGAPDGQRYIVAQKGSCRWAPPQGTQVDAFTFRTLVQHAQEEDVNRYEKISFLSEAIELYRGDLLMGNEPHLRTACGADEYRQLYIDAATQLITLLRDENRMERLINVCREALDIDPYNEVFQKELMLGLAALGRNDEALEQFYDMTDLYFSRQGVRPPETLRALYDQIAQTEESKTVSIDSISRQMEASNIQKEGAFTCAYEVFAYICRREMRNNARYGGLSFLCLLTVENEQSTEDGQKPLRVTNRAMQQLQDILQRSLRSGDAIARCSPNQFAILLPGGPNGTYETTDRVLTRLQRIFRREHPKSSVHITYHVRPIGNLPEASKKA